MIHDPRLGGLDRAKKFFSLLKKEKIPNELVFELFFPAGDDFFQMIQESIARWSLEVTIETADENLRKLDALKFPVPNSRIEDTIASVLSHGCRRLDLFFMVGIPHQTYEDVMKTVPYCERLINRFKADPRLQFFIAPMGPFLDPASGAFEDPKFGYKHFYLTLEEHRQALLQPTWKSILSYETDAMSRDQILAASYDAAAELNDLKFRYGLIDSATHEGVRSHQQAAKAAIVEIDQALLLPEDQRHDALVKIQAKVEAANVDSLFSKRELDWRGGEGLRFGTMLLGTLSIGLAEEVVHGFNRLVGRYDTAIYRGPRATPFSQVMKTLETQFPEVASNAPLAPRSACQRARRVP